jgi:transcriptional regulator with GAF, ATPase, and Fis domain
MRRVCQTLPDVGSQDWPLALELARLRRVATIDELLTVLVDVLDVREVFARISEITGRVLSHDAITVIVLTEDREHVVPHAIAGPAATEPPGPHPLPDSGRRLFAEPWEFEIIDDLQADSAHPPHLVAAGYRAMLRVPVRLQQRVEAVLVILSRTSGCYGEADVAVARRVADHVALALSHQRLAEKARQTEVLRARTTTLELLDGLLADLVDAGPLPAVFDRLSAIARKVLPHDMVLMAVATPDGRHARTYACSGDNPFQVSDVWEIPPEILEQPHFADEICDDMSAHPIWRRYDAPKRGYKSAIHLMIHLDGALAASIAFFSFTSAAYKEADLLVARRIRDRVALSLARERGAEASKQASEAAERASLLEVRVRALTDELNARAGARRIVGDSPAWRRALTLATQVASTQATVLLLGESGTGKEVVARFIHGASPQSRGPFMALNCAALPEQLLEAELFGYERGAFTGATQSKPGQLEMASGGVLFLDEVGEMSLSAQAKFLRVLQEREFLRVGGTRVLKTDARIIAASNRDLQKAIGHGQFREDLYYRLDVFAIHLPPLRERRDDVLPLTEAFVHEIGQSIGRPPAGVSREARQALMNYHWPGNVRELRNILERAAILCDGGLIAAEHLAFRSPATPTDVAFPAASAASPVMPPDAAAPTDLKSIERTMIEKALKKAHFNKSEAAKALGLTRAQLYVRLRKYGLDKHTLKAE